jgi:hypothetical protein
LVPRVDHVEALLHRRRDQRLVEGQVHRFAELPPATCVVPRGGEGADRIFFL